MNKRTNIDKALFIEVCKNSNTMSVASQKLNLPFNTFKRYAIKFGVYIPSKYHGWNKGLTKDTDFRVRKISTTINSNYKSGKLIPTWKGKHLSNEHKRNCAISTCIYLIQTHGGPRYNKSSISILENIAKEHGWNIQHAENGGEFYTGIGYFVDAYDKEKNIVLEYDEPAHYVDVENNVLRLKDLDRQRRIIEHLHCEYWRYNEKTKVLWKVN